MSCAFYFDAKVLGRSWGFDFKNQALSGTDSTLVEVATHFAETDPEVFLLVTAAPVDSSAKVFVVNDLPAAIRECVQRRISTLVFVAISNTEQMEIFRNYKSQNVSLIVWAQCTPGFEYLTAAYRCSGFSRLIAVTNVQAYEMSHHPIYNRICVVPNFVNLSFWNERDLSNHSKDTTVSFVGALKTAKGFHHLANIWPVIRSNHPTATLKVCGSPGLYGRTDPIGEYGIAESNYEKTILEPLGGSLNSARAMGVEFLGSLTKHELRSQICKSQLVVANPNIAGSTETFCVSAAESLAMGVPVIGGAAGGLLEVVGHEQGGLLASNSQELLDYVNDLIEQPARAVSLGQEGRFRVRQFYSKEVVLARWRHLLKDESLVGLTPHHQELRPKDFLLRSCIRRIFPLSVINGIRQVRRALHKLTTSA